MIGLQIRLQKWLTSSHTFATNFIKATLSNSATLCFIRSTLILPTQTYIPYKQHRGYKSMRAEHLQQKWVPISIAPLSYEPLMWNFDITGTNLYLRA